MWCIVSNIITLEPMVAAIMTSTLMSHTYSADGMWTGM